MRRLNFEWFYKNLIKSISALKLGPIKWNMALKRFCKTIMSGYHFKNVSFVQDVSIYISASVCYLELTPFLFIVRLFFYSVSFVFSSANKILIKTFFSSSYCLGPKCLWHERNSKKIQKSATIGGDMLREDIANDGHFHRSMQKYWWNFWKRHYFFVHRTTIDENNMQWLKT